MEDVCYRDIAKYKKSSKFLTRGYYAACNTDGTRLEYVNEDVRM